MWVVSREAIIGVTRTAITYFYAFLLSQAPVVDGWLVGEGLSGEVQASISGTFVVVVGTAIYTAIRAAAEKWPRVGRLLIFNTKPTYS